MKNTVNRGIYPAMLTPLTKDNKVDVGGVKALTQWYAEKGCQGIFASCLSSEIFGLSLEERILISKTTVEAAPKGVDVVVSGHTMLPTAKGIDELKALADTGAKALVLITSRLAEENDDESVILRNLESVMKAIPDIDLGLYECPVPYQKFASPELLRFCAETDRFVFMKDTSCSVTDIKPKLEAVKGSRFQIFNANSATLLDSVKDGAAGLCGVMANYHPDLYVRLMELADNGDYEKAQELQDILGVLSSISYGNYPVTAKAYLQTEGLPFEACITRARPEGLVSEAERYEIEQRFALTNRLRKEWL
ncbi:MAG: dihydrodipicolinate synthase family protein [Clostridia bacterium]|nr:dihydrodipicolinate synthase family protein [Clostridia bacterium]